MRTIQHQRLKVSLSSASGGANLPDIQHPLLIRRYNYLKNDILNVNWWVANWFATSVHVVVWDTYVTNTRICSIDYIITPYLWEPECIRLLNSVRKNQFFI